MSKKLTEAQSILEEMVASCSSTVPADALEWLIDLAEYAEQRWIIFGFAREYDSWDWTLSEAKRHFVGLISMPGIPDEPEIPEGERLFICAIDTDSDGARVLGCFDADGYRKLRSKDGTTICLECDGTGLEDGDPWDNDRGPCGYCTTGRIAIRTPYSKENREKVRRKGDPDQDRGGTANDTRDPETLGRRKED